MSELKWIDSLGNFTTDLLLLAIGILFFTQRYTGWTILYILALLLCIALPVRILLNIRSGISSFSSSTLILILFNIFFAITILLQPLRFLEWAHVFFGWWMFGNGIIQLVEFYVLIRDQLPGTLPKLLSSIFSLLIAFLIIFGRDLSIKTDVLSIIAGVYFLLYGVMGMLFHISLIVKRRNPESPSWSYSAPILLNAFFPLEVYISLRRLEQASKLSPPKSTEHADLYVYTYIKGKGPEALGHIDLSYKGMILSYGNHDPETRQLVGTLGDGVLIRAKENEFLQESITTDGKTVVRYGIRLTESQRKALEERIRKLFARTVPWQCAAEKAYRRGEDMTPYHDYASRVFRETFCEMFKFTQGKFRTYFISSTNCVLLADELIRNKDLNLIHLNGLVTPGAYLSFLNTEYLKADSPVISRTFYKAGVNEPLPDRKPADTVPAQPYAG